MKAVRPALALLAALFITSCGGGSGGSSAVSPAAPGAPGSTSQQKTVSGSIVLSIPTQTSSSKVRYPQFVSPNASSVSIVANGGTAQIFDVSATSSLCTTTSGARTCTLTFGAPVGSDTIVLTIFSGPNGTGATLATTTTTTTVTAGTPFNVTVAMNAAIGTVIATITPGTGGNCNLLGGVKVQIPESCPSNTSGNNASLTVAADDPSGAQITGTAPYATPIQVSGNDPSLSASPTSITAPGQTVTLSYSGAPLAQSLGNTATISLTIGSQVVPVSIPILRANLYVANSNCPPPCSSGSPGGGNIEVYPFGASGSATPIRTLAGSSTSLSNPLAPLLDASGNLYVLDNGPYTTQSHPLILVFAAGANGNVAPMRQITQIASIDSNQACENFTSDPTGQYLLVACDDIFSNGIHVFLASSNSIAASAQTATLKCATSCFSHTIGMAFDPSGNLWVAETGNNDIFSFAHGTFSMTGTNQMITPQTTLNGTSGIPWPGNPTPGPAYINPLGLGFDTSGNMYVDIVNAFNTTGGDALNRVSIWNSSTLPGCNNCVPNITLSGTPFTTHFPAGMAGDYGGNLYVGNQVTNTINVFAKSSLGSSAANLPILRTINTGSSPNSPGGITIGP
ncbi:MAG TPA: hypothetical protein VN905_15030 [Candidatus Binatia bacterium]|nr:hypothetical protein [Candidatus Binatia bacterium]